MNSDSPIDKKDIKKILLIKLRGIGDVILSTVVIKNLLRDFPKAKLDFLTEKPGISFLKNTHELNRTLIFPKRFNERLKQLYELRNENYNLIFDFYSNPSTALFTFLSGAKYRVGFPYRGRKYAYNLFGPAERNKFHAAQLHLEVLRNVNLYCDFVELKFGMSNEDVKFAEVFFASNIAKNTLTIGISPSGGWSSKKCDPQKFAEIADLVVERYNSEILILWGPEDKEDAEIIHKLMKAKSILAPSTTICQMGALISMCSALIANDSGPMHISTAVGTPTLSLHGPTNPNMQGPFGNKHEWVRLDELDCIECNLLDCPRGHECFLSLPTEKILNKFDILLKKNLLI